MKNRVNQILLAAFLTTAALYAPALLSIPTAGPLSKIPLPLLKFWLLGFHMFPCFFLQLLVCRTAKKLVIRLFPVFLLFGTAACFLINFVNTYIANGWDVIAWGFMLCLCVAPAAGCAAAWAVYGIQWTIRRGKHN